jgi:hypothetical protein
VTPANRWGTAPRTKADRENDLSNFLTMARADKVREATAEDLAQRYGVDLKIAKYKLAIAQQRLGA